MSKEYYCTIGNVPEQEDKIANPLILHIAYKTKNENTVLSLEDSQTLADMINERLGGLFSDILDVFPELSAIDISISEKSKEDS
jgi:hypothetical protein